MGKADKPLRVGGYCRTSGEGQRDNTSIPEQKTGIEAKCRAEGWILVRFYVDECKSGAKTAGRDAFNRMVRDAQAGELDIIVPYDNTRFGRDGVDIVSTAKLLKEKCGVFTVDSKGQLDNRTHRNALINFTLAGVSEHERLTIMERTFRGKIAMAKAGLPWSGHLPVGRGFAWEDKKKKIGEWFINETGRKLAALLARYIKHESLTDLVREFGFSSPDVIFRMIRDGQLSAKPYVVTFTHPEIGIQELRVDVPAVPTVISAALEADVKDRLQHNKSWNKQNLRKYILSGFIRCAHCGLALTSQTVDGVAYYRHHRGRKTCPFRSIREDAVKDIVLDHLYRWFIDQPAFEMALTLALPSAGDRSEKEAAIKQAERDYDKAEKEIANLVNAIAAGADPTLLIGKQQALKEQRDTLRSRLRELGGELASLPDPAAVRQDAEVMRCILASEQTGKDWRNESFDDIQRFLRFLFSENPKRGGLGIFVRRVGSEWTAEIRARLRLHSPELLIGEDGIGRLCGMPEGETVEGKPFQESVDLLRRSSS